MAIQPYALPHPTWPLVSSERSRYWIILTFGVAVTLSILAIFASSLAVPYVGVDVTLESGSWRLKRVDPNGTAYRDGLRPNDMVLRINGLDPARVAGAPDYLGGYRVQNLEAISLSGEIKQVSQTGPVPAGVFGETVSYFVLAFAFLALGFVSFVKRPQSRVVFWLYLMSLSVAAAPILALGAPRGWLQLRALEAINGIVAPWLVARFFLEFPPRVRSSLVGRHARKLSYLPPLLLLVIYIVLGRHDTAFYTWFRPLIMMNLIMGFILSLGVLVHGYFVTRFGRSRQQIKILTLGVAAAILPFILLTVIPEALGSVSLVPPYVAAMSLVIMPFSVGHALLDHKLLDVDRALSQALSYVLTFLPLAATGVLVVWVISIVQPHLGISWLVLVFGSLMVAVAFALSPVAVEARDTVSAWLNRGRYDYGRAATTVIAEMSSKTDVMEVSSLLASSVAGFLGLEGSCVLLGNTSENLVFSAVGGIYAQDPERKAQCAKNAHVLSEDDQFPNQAPDESGAAFFIPLSRAEGQVGMLVLGHKRSAADFSADDVYFLLIIQTQASLAIDNTMLLFEAREHSTELEAANTTMKEFAVSLEESGKALELAYLNTIRTLVLALESRNPYTKEHSERVSVLARRVAVEMGLAPNGLRDVEVAGLIHDIGKIGVADQILLKPGPLEMHERAEVELHVVRGVEILRFLEFLSDVIPAVEYHHERYDGKGYPRGLVADEIPLSARILAVADAFDAMTSDRPHRHACTANEALRTLREGAGTQWDPAVVDAFQSVSIDPI